MKWRWEAVLLRARKTLLMNGKRVCGGRLFPSCSVCTSSRLPRVVGELILGFHGCYILLPGHPRVCCPSPPTAGPCLSRLLWMTVLGLAWLGQTPNGVSGTCPAFHS